MNFRNYLSFFQEESVDKRSLKLLQQYAKNTKKWNSEWTIRIFYAAKMVLASSLMAQSLKFSDAKNLRSVSSYLSHYIVIHSLRAIMFTDPQVSWNGGEILQATHTKTINVACSAIAKLDRDFSEYVKKSVFHLKAFWELISYRAPSSGDNFPKPDFDVYEYCRCFLEIAQYQSELLEASIARNVTDIFELNQNFTQLVTDVDIEGIHFHDDDWCRIGYFARKYPSPANILHVISEGHV